MNYPIRDTASNIDKPVWSIWLNSPHLSFSGTFKTIHHSALTTVHDIRSMNLQDTQTKNFESNYYAHYPLDSKTTRNWHLVCALKMPKECDILQKKKNTKKEKTTCHLRWGSEMGFISISIRCSSRKFPTFSASLAIWISQGLLYWWKTFTTKRGIRAATTMMNKHNQNAAVLPIWKMALSIYTDLKH